MNRRKTLFYTISTIILIFVFAYLIFDRSNDLPSPAPSDATYNLLPSNGDEVQKVIIGMKNFNYYPNTITVKVGKPVSISLDSSVGGCFRDFTIRELGIRKYLKTTQDTIEFMPTKPGTYQFACSMGMGVGTLIVK